MIIISLTSHQSHLLDFYDFDANAFLLVDLVTLLTPGGFGVPSFLNSFVPSS